MFLKKKKNWSPNTLHDKSVQNGTQKHTNCWYWGISKGYHVYKSIWIPTKDEHLHAAMQATNELDKYAVAVPTEDSKVIGHLSLGKPGKFPKTISYYLKTTENNVCVVVVTGNPVNQGGGKRMKVPCSLQFTAEQKYINVLKDTLEALI